MSQQRRDMFIQNVLHQGSWPNLMHASPNVVAKNLKNIINRKKLPTQMIKSCPPCRLYPGCLCCDCSRCGYRLPLDRSPPRAILSGRCAGQVTRAEAAVRIDSRTRRRFRSWCQIQERAASIVTAAATTASNTIGATSNCTTAKGTASADAFCRAPETETGCDLSSAASAATSEGKSPR